MSTVNPFGNLTNAGLEESEDRLGGGFQPQKTGAYDVTIKAFYAGVADSGAKNVSVIAILPDGKEYRETIYVTNKKGENFFLNKDDNSKKVPLPGFTTIDDICLAATGFPLAEQSWEEKTIKLYDFDAKKEMNKAVMMATGVLGQPVTLGILQNLEDKTKKNDSTGEYEPTGETRTTNTIGKVFHTESKVTMAEARNAKTEGEFYVEWCKRNTAETIVDKRKDKGAGGGKPVQKAPPQAGGSAAAGAPAKKSLFGPK